MLMYKVNGGIELMNLDEVLRYFIDNIDSEYYDDMLDECYEEVNILGYTYSPSVALYRVDEIAYNCGFNDWKDSEVYGYIKEEIEGLDLGEEEEYYGINVECIDVEHLLDLDGETLEVDEIEDYKHDEYVIEVKQIDDETYEIHLVTEDVVTVYVEHEEEDEE